MFKSTFDPRKPLQFIRYGRMSSDLQNRRSPDQQFFEIDQQIRRQGYPWVHIGDYRDSGVSGRLIMRRPGLQRMLGDIRSRRIKPDVLLVDTFERFGRADEMTVIRRELLNQHGVYILTADSHFADPTTPQGKALGVMESMRSTEDTRLKAHNVLRGKLDTVMLRRWPGSTPPFGYRAQTVLITRDSRQEVDYSFLQPDPATAWIIQRLFAKALATGWGQGRLARFLNDDPDIPEVHKPFPEGTVGSWLRKTIYYGTYRWNEYCTDLIDDRQVEQKNPEEEVLVIPDFCEPLVSKETWEAVKALRDRRADGIRRGRAAKAAATPGKLIAPLVTGMSVKYVLAGLVRCGECGRAMTPMASSPYTAKNGEARRYVHYHCPASPSGVCANRKCFSEAWLREVVIGRIADHLFLQNPENPE